METKKKQVFNGQELAMLFQAFSKKNIFQTSKGRYLFKNPITRMIIIVHFILVYLIMTRC